MRRRALFLATALACAAACTPETRTDVQLKPSPRASPEQTPAPSPAPSPGDATSGSSSPDETAEPHPALLAVEQAPTWLEIRATLQRLLRDPEIPWAVVDAGISAAAERARGQDQEAEVAAWRAALAFNSDAERAYVEAVALVQKGEVADYPRARELFACVPKGALVYPDAEAYLGWLEADALVREASESFARAEVGPALDLLARALENPFLGPEAVAGVRTRARDWGLALEGLQAMERAQDLAALRASATRVMALTSLAGHPVYRIAQRAFLTASGREVEPDEELEAIRPRFLSLPRALIERARLLSRGGPREDLPPETPRAPAPSRPVRSLGGT